MITKKKARNKKKISKKDSLTDGHLRSAALVFTAAAAGLLALYKAGTLLYQRGRPPKDS